MDKQDFQEQDFMEILMRLPCHTKRKLFLPASRNTYPCKDSAFSLQGENKINKAKNHQAIL